MSPNKPPQSSGRRDPNKNLAEDARGILTILINNGATVHDLGTPAFKLRAGDDQYGIIKAVREEAARVTEVKIASLENKIPDSNPIPENLKLETSLDALKNSIQKFESRFHRNTTLHPGCNWNKVQSSLKKNPKFLWSIHQMEINGHEPDVFHFDDHGFDIGTCSLEVPKTHTLCVYDQEAEDYLKQYYPDAKFNGNAIQILKTMGARPMTEDQYKENLQNKGVLFDQESECWLLADRSSIKSGTALVGGRTLNSIWIGSCERFKRNPDRGCRGTLRVPWQ
ncbi:hypothetical protein CVV38_00470 [Candidatus Peregrinibacteria bacterium HGW-Peregrinibacteria-1]|jgi:hypothetical protein|nr:MAG: hypothetical protein CVV38_00470 [Candidatus Peregrinibacteria bacterium HGW-Peregrinibacteria-1]